MDLEAMRASARERDSAQAVIAGLENELYELDENYRSHRRDLEQALVESRVHLAEVQRAHGRLMTTAVREGE